MTIASCRSLAALVAAAAVVLGACAIEQDLAPRVDAAPSSTSEEADGGPADPSGTETTADVDDEPAGTPGSPAPDATTGPGPNPSPANSPAPVNQAPSATADVGSTSEDAPVQVAVLANDRDPDGDELTLASVDTPVAGVAHVRGEHVVYTPDTDFHGEDRFTYVVSDGRGGTDTALVTITVRPVNDVPVGTADGPYLLQQGASITLTALLDNDGDPDGDEVAIALVTDGAYGRASLVDDTTVEYVHGGSAASAEDVFTYRITDGTTRSAPIEVHMDVNRRPVAADDAMTVRVSNREVFSFNVITGAVGSGCCSSRESWSGGRDTDADRDALEYVGPRGLRVRPNWMTSFDCAADGWCRIGVDACTGLAEPYRFDYTIRDARGGQDLGEVSFRPLSDCID